MSQTPFLRIFTKTKFVFIIYNKVAVPVHNHVVRLNENYFIEDSGLDNLERLNDVFC